MSSNRSNSGAKQRRAGEPIPTVGPRSNTSIGSQQIFAKQQINQQQFQHKQQVQQQLPRTIPKGVGAAPSPLPQSQDPNDSQQMSKLTIPKAFTLVTLRLGRIEQFIQQIQEDGLLQPYDKTGETELEDEYLKNIVSRIESLEKNTKVATPTDNKVVDELKANFVKFEKDLRETKDMLMLMMMKYEKSTLETNDKISHLFSQIEELNKPIEYEETSLIEDHYTNHEYVEEGPISAVNLKEEIESELAKDV